MLDLEDVLMIKVLTVDDEPLIRESIVAFLEDTGFEVVEAENGKQALEILNQDNEIAVVLCDLHMPVMNGLELLIELRKQENEIPFIILAATDNATEAIGAIQCGASDYIFKPITDMNILERSIKQTLERQRLVRENQQYRIEIEKANKELSQKLAEIKEDQEAARVVQFQLLPQKNLEVNNFSFSHNILPSLYLSGDFVDYFQITDNKLGFYIADVSGHGAPSAFVTVLLKSMVNQMRQKFQSGEDDVILHPTKVLKMLSVDIHKAKLGKYLTMVYCTIDLETDLFSYSIGGHFPNPIFYETNTPARYLEGKGFPVGVFDKAEYQLHEFKLPEEFSLVMFSDGVLEILPQKDLQDQEDYLLSLVTSVEVDRKHILTELGLPRKEALPDDVTFIIVKRSKSNV